jgi:C-terminal processing protease CtpA/Prc
VVLDLRYNGGGNESILQPFIDGMLSRPALNTEQTFFVLIGRETYSSALGNALTLKTRSNATFIGEPTGGKPNHYGEVRQFRLPNSRLIVQYPTWYWLNLRDDDPPSLVPDITAPPTMDAALAGRDPALEIALK